MSIEQESGEFHFIERGTNESADEFLKRRLLHIENRFSYERLSGCSIEELDAQRQQYNFYLENMRSRFASPDFIFADDVDMYKELVGKEVELYDSLSSDQRMQIQSVAGKVHINFDKALEDARDRKFQRLSMAMDSIPVLNQLKK
ncbi:hypothetical protein [Natronorubrum texcoconense]|uniref:hypothetical protein n=1 Tax=Natronorubrum texcoconense TaxID=1095776 RepID=UPI0011142B96|nr:hypothetical protein [Natronorubrum texcoconense]